MFNTPIPLIKLEVEHMRHTLAVAMSEYTVQFDDTLQKSIEQFCTPENIERIIRAEADRTMDEVLREEVKRWFTHGEGRAIIKQAVEKNLRENTTYTPLDDEWLPWWKESNHLI